MSILFKYKNHRGEISVRNLEVDAVEFLPAPGFGYQPGWFISGLDLDKSARRSFALSHIIFPEGSKIFRIPLKCE